MAACKDFNKLHLKGSARLGQNLTNQYVDFGILGHSLFSPCVHVTLPAPSQKVGAVLLCLYICPLCPVPGTPPREIGGRRDISRGGEGLFADAPRALSSPLSAPTFHLCPLPPRLPLVPHPLPLSSSGCCPVSEEENLFSVVALAKRASVHPSGPHAPHPHHAQLWFQGHSHPQSQPSLSP